MRALPAILELFLLAYHYCNAQAVPPSGCTLKSSPPAGDICGVTGTDPVYPAKGFLTFRQRIPTLTQCRDFCLRRPNRVGGLGCSNFRFDQATSTCIYNSNPLMSVTEDPSSGVVYYNRSCFHCPPACPPSIGVNLFDNPGFELSRHFLAPWTSRSGGRANGRITHGGAYGNSSRSYSAKGENNGVAQDFFTCPGVIYEFGFDYRTNAKSQDAYGAELEFDNFDDDYFINIRLGGDAKKWHTYTSLLTFNQSGVSSFSYVPDVFIFESSNVLEADNFKLIPTAYTFDTVPGAANTLINGDFETGSLSPWTPFDSKNVTVVSPGINSAHALQYRYAPTNLDEGLAIKQKFGTTTSKLVPGAPYLLSMDYASNVPNLNMTLSYSIAPARGENFSKNFFITDGYEAFLGQNGTAEMAFTGQSGDFNGIRLIFILAGQTPRSGGIFLLDNISIKQLAPPPGGG